MNLQRNFYCHHIIFNILIVILPYFLENLSDNERADEDVDVGGIDPPPMSSSPIRIDKDAAERNSNCIGSRSSSSESGASSTGLFHYLFLCILFLLPFLFICLACHEVKTQCMNLCY